MLKLLTDQDLVRLFKNGHPKAFEEILNRYESKIYHFILRFFKNQELAEEMEQDVFMKVYEKLDTYNADMKFSTWIFSITRNLCIDEYRKTDAKKETEHHQDDRDIKRLLAQLIGQSCF